MIRRERRNERSNVNLYKATKVESQLLKVLIPMTKRKLPTEPYVLYRRRPLSAKTLTPSCCTQLRKHIPIGRFCRRGWASNTCETTLPERRKSCSIGS